MLEAPSATPTDPTTEVTPAGLRALLSSVAFVPLDKLGFIRVTGEDRVRWLNGMVTNSIQSLKPGEGCYTFFLSAQGRIQGDATAFALPDSILLQTSRDRIPALLALLDRFIIMDDVELAELPLTGLLIAGPDALSTVQGIGGTPCSTPARPNALPTTLNLKQTTYGGAPVNVIQAYSPLVPRYEIWADPPTIVQIATELASAPQATSQDLENLRLLEGTPLYGIDIREKELPQETAQTRALHFSKGCYLGQEIVERIHSRGNVHRTFASFTFSGELPIPGTALFAAESPDKPVGEITSAALIPLAGGEVGLALGYIRREALELVRSGAANLRYTGGSIASATLPWRIL